MRVYTLSDMRSEKKLRVYTASEAKGLMTSFGRGHSPYRSWHIRAALILISHVFAIR